MIVGFVYSGEFPLFNKPKTIKFHHNIPHIPSYLNSETNLRGISTQQPTQRVRSHTNTKSETRRFRFKVVQISLTSAINKWYAGLGIGVKMKSIGGSIACGCNVFFQVADKSLKQRDFNVNEWDKDFADWSSKHYITQTQVHINHSVSVWCSGWHFSRLIH